MTDPRPHEPVEPPTTVGDSEPTSGAPGSPSARLLTVCQQPTVNDAELDALIAGMDRWTLAGTADEQGRTVLMHAARHRDERHLAALIRISDPLAQDRNGATALMMAAQAGRHDNVAVLLQVSDPHAQDHQGWTALTYATLWNRSPFTSIALLLAGATPDEMVEAFELTLVNRRPPPGRMIVAALPYERLAAARRIVDDQLSRTMDPSLFIGMHQALHEREQALLNAEIATVPLDPNHRALRALRMRL